MSARGEKVDARKPVSLLAVASHPVQYSSPLFRRISEDPRVDLTVAFISLKGAEAHLDPDMGVELEWDVPLLEGFSWVGPPLERRARFARSAGTWLWSLIRKRQFDVVLCYGYDSVAFWLAILAAKTSGSNLLLSSEATGFESRSGTSRAKLMLKQLLVPRILRLADGWLGVSSSATRFLARIGLPAERVFLTPYVVDNEFFSDGTRVLDRSAERARWGLPDGVPVALFCGKFVPWKRPHDLITSAARVEDLFVLMVGGGPLKEELVNLSDRLGISSRVRFAGFVNQRSLPGVYLASDFLVLPSGYEGFGLVVNEAFACGRPAIVTSACGVAADLVRDGTTGYVYRAGDVAGLSRALARFATHPALAADMGESARATIDEWGPKEHVSALVEACTQIVRGRG